MFKNEEKKDVVKNFKERLNETKSSLEKHDEPKEDKTHDDSQDKSEAPELRPQNS